MTKDRIKAKMIAIWDIDEKSPFEEFKKDLSTVAEIDGTNLGVELCSLEAAYAFASQVPGLSDALRKDALRYLCKYRFWQNGKYISDARANNIVAFESFINDLIMEKDKFKKIRAAFIALAYERDEGLVETVNDFTLRRAVYAETDNEVLSSMEYYKEFLAELRFLCGSQVETF